MLKDEFKFIGKNRMILLSVLVIMLIPFLYSIFFLKSVWDPYGDTKDLPVAVVNQDKAVDYQGKTIAVGDEMVKTLKKDDQLGWRFVSAAQAKKGMKDNKYYTVITIPSNFSANAATVLKDKPKKMNLTYETNDSLNYLSQVISGVGVDKLNSEIRAKVTNVYASALFSQMKLVGKGMTKAADGATQLGDGLVTLDNGLNKYTVGVSQVNDGLQTMKVQVSPLSSGVQQLATGASQLDTGLGQLNGKVAPLASGVSRLNGGASQVSNGLSVLYGKTGELQKGASQLATGSTSLVGGLTTYTAGVGSLAKGINEMAAQAPELTKGVNDLNSGAAGLANGVASMQSKVSEGNQQSAQALQAALQETAGQMSNDADKAAVAALGQKINAIVGASSTSVSDGLSSIASGANQLSAGTAQLANSTGALVAGINKLNTGSTQLNANSAAIVAGAKELEAGTAKLNGQVPALVTGVSQLNSGAAQVSTGLTTLNGQIPALTSGVGQLATGATQLDNGLGQLNGQIPTLMSGVNQLASGASELNGNSGQLTDGASKLQTGSKSLATQLGSGAKQINGIKTTSATSDMFAAPTKVTHKNYSYVPNYGHALAPYVLSLALYVGALVFNFAYPIRKVSKADGTATQWFVSKAVLGGVVAVGAAVVEATLMMVGGLTVAHVGQYYLFAILFALASMYLVMFLSMLLDNPGRFIAMVLLMLQLGGSGGTFPMEITNGFYNAIHPFLPMTYSILGFRNALTGGIASGTTTGAVWFLILVSGVSLLLLWLSMIFLQRRHLMGISQLDNNQELQAVEK
ncbi:YhgE/Pip domain-containing protein [Lacticaseibacillus brantae]|uniref:Phage infection protein n=1 Tax=Lacticaseibacillus brantae DSM 23927 TaxID=1423727 RepID=A0A0R2AY97_9LACO|nr:YhgE/Pip domain-containing protein [Lacticaseibacillus brantae]KRM71722.1 phage infection protein [Lacticaseibacillus brantae DSM 23927]